MVPPLNPVYPKRDAMCRRLRLSGVLLVLAAYASGADRVQAQPQPSDAYPSFASDGAWCWFSDPRSIRYEDQTYAGWVDSKGNIVVGAFDHGTGNVQTQVIHDTLEVDDHASPSLLVLEDGRLAVFYSKHADDAISMRVAERPRSIATWQPLRRIAANAPDSYEPGLRDRYCYTNPYRLTGEDGRIYLFWRGLGNKPNLTFSDDGGETWAPGRILVKPEDTYKDQRPYLKAASNGRDRIHLAFTNGHPRDEPANGVYYMQYRDGAFYRADGSKVADMDDLPVDPFEADLVYDARNTGVRAWIWDVAEGPDGYPVIVYARLPSGEDHRYHYARFDGRRWHDYEITAGGGWFPETPPGKEERENYYSGGVVLDHGDPSIVYLSRPENGVFEIQRWTTPDGGRTWKTEAVTSESDNNNVRPFVVRGSTPGQGPHLLWIMNRRYAHYTDYDSAVMMDDAAPPGPVERGRD